MLVFFVYIEHGKFQKASFDSNRGGETKSSGSLPSPHPVYAVAKFLK